MSYSSRFSEQFLFLSSFQDDLIRIILTLNQYKKIQQIKNQCRAQNKETRIKEIEFEKNLLPSNFNFLKEAIDIWQTHQLVIKKALPYVLDNIFVQNEKKLQQIHFATHLHRKNYGNVQIIRYFDKFCSNYYKQQFQILMELENDDCDFVEFIQWPLILLPKADDEFFHKVAIPTAFQSVTLESMINFQELIYEICSDFNIDFDYFILHCIIGTLKCLLQLHERKLAHRNIQPRNIIYSLKDYKFKLNHLEYAINYQNHIDYYEIIGNDDFLVEEIKNYRSENESKLKETKKIKQNLLWNDVLALGRCFYQFLAICTKAITDVIALFSKIPNLICLEKLINLCENWQNKDLSFEQIFEDLYYNNLWEEEEVKVIETWKFTNNLNLKIKDFSIEMYQQSKQVSDCCNIIELELWDLAHARNLFEYSRGLTSAIERIMATSHYLLLNLRRKIFFFFPQIANQIQFVLLEELKQFAEMDPFLAHKIQFNRFVTLQQLKLLNESLVGFNELQLQMEVESNFDNLEKIIIYLQTMDHLSKICQSLKMNEQEKILTMNRTFKQSQFHGIDLDQILSLIKTIDQNQMNDLLSEIVIPIICQNKLFQYNSVPWGYCKRKTKNGKFVLISQLTQLELFKKIFTKRNQLDLFYDTLQNRKALTIAKQILEEQQENESVLIYKWFVILRLGIISQTQREVNNVKLGVIEVNKINLFFILSRSFYLQTQLKLSLACLSKIELNNSGDIIKILYFRIKKEMKNQSQEIPELFKEQKDFDNRFQLLPYELCFTRYKGDYEQACQLGNRLLEDQFKSVLFSNCTIFILFEISKNLLNLKKLEQGLEVLKTALFIEVALLTKVQLIQLAAFTGVILEGKSNINEMIEYFFLLMIPRKWQQILSISLPFIQKKKRQLMNTFYKRFQYFIASDLMYQEELPINNEIIKDILFGKPGFIENYFKFQAEFCENDLEVAYTQAQTQKSIVSLSLKKDNLPDFQ